MKNSCLKIGLGLSLVASSLLAQIEKPNLKIGFIALTDCAPIVIAKEKGFFAKHGLNVDALKENFKGYVKNLPNGDVEACVTCKKEDTERFLEILKQGSPDSIVEKIEIFPSTLSFTGIFHIRYDEL
jgi:acylphosphatase